ncbi:MAG: ribbon-helix-helix domain-containing protein [Anaerotignaceae bacterium]
MISIAEKRKTTTSSEVKNRYNAKVYGRLNIQLPKDLVSRFKEKCKAENISQANIIKDAIEKFLGE